MAKQSSVNLDITNNADGFSIAGGSTSRTLGVSGADITLVGSGTATLTFPTTSTTIAGLGITQEFTALQSFSAGISASVVTTDGGYRVASNAINSRTGTTYSLLSTDDGKVIVWNATSGSTLTVPSGLSVGFNVTVISVGTGSIGITGASGVTLNSFENKLRIAGQHAAVSIISYNSNVFNVAGGLTG